MLSHIRYPLYSNHDSALHEATVVSHPRLKIPAAEEKYCYDPAPHSHSSKAETNKGCHFAVTIGCFDARFLGSYAR